MVITVKSAMSVPSKRKKGILSNCRSSRYSTDLNKTAIWPGSTSGRTPKDDKLKWSFASRDLRAFLFATLGTKRPNCSRANLERL